MNRRHSAIVGVAVVLLAILHQDFWLWDDASLVFGFLPVGLAYHATFAVVASLFWLAVVRWAWSNSPSDRGGAP